ncbi:MAG TPA: hypothetical protein VGJ20_43445 [Xanthobacteraceae bacterium]|jgi:hypothetical protein
MKTADDSDDSSDFYARLLDHVGQRSNRGDICAPFDPMLANAEEIQRGKCILNTAGYKVHPEARVLTVNDKATIEAHMLDLGKGGSEDVVGMLKVYQNSLGSRMGRYLAATNAISFRDRNAASGGRHVEGELVVILPEA